MKKNAMRCRILAASLFLSLFCIHTREGGSAESGKSASNKPNVTDVVLDGHPRLLLDVADLPQMREQVVKNPLLLRIHESIMDYANQSLTKPVNERVLQGIRLLQVSVDNLTCIFYNSYAYRMTGEEKYARRAITEMLAAASFDDWNPSHFLDVAEMTFALAIGYDWCYPALSDDFRMVIRNAIIEKGLKPGLEERYNKRWLNKNANWNQVCGTGMLFGALAVEDHAPGYAEKYWPMLGESISLPMGEMYTPSGAYPEGPGYWIYGTSYNVIFLAQCAKENSPYINLIDRNPDFLKTIDYANAMITPTLGTFAYMDHAFKAQVGIVPFWFYSYMGDPSCLYQQARILNSLNQITLDDCRHRRLLPASIVFSTTGRKLPAKMDEPKWLAYVGVGGRTPVAAFRSGWSSSDDLFLGLKAGRAWISHGHMDIGSFYMEADGVRWATELGSEIYEKVEKMTNYEFWEFRQDSRRWDLIRYSDRGHSVLIFDDRRMNPKERAEIDDFSKDETLMYASTDLSAIYSESVRAVRRTVSMEEKRYAVIADRVETGDKPTVMRWNMCTEATSFTKKEDNHYVLALGDKVLHMIIEANNPVEGATWSAEPKSKEECPNPNRQFVGFESTLAAGKVFDFKVFLIPDKAFAEFTKSRN